MSLPTSQPLPQEDDMPLPPARRRHKRRQLVPGSLSERAAFMEELARKVVPSFDFFLFSILAGLILGLACLLDSPALFILAVLVAPFMAPVPGLSLAISVGSLRFFFQALGGMGIGSLMVFLCGMLAGWATRFLPAHPLGAFQGALASTSQAVLHSRFTWPDFVVLTLGAILTAILLVRYPRQKPLPSSIAMAYELYLPIGVAGFGLVSHEPGLWPDGLIVFAVFLAWAVLVGTLTLAVLGLRPLNLLSYTLGTTLALAGVAMFIAISGIGAAVTTQVAMIPPTPTPIPPTLTLTLPPTRTATPSPSLPPTITNTPTNTLIPTRTQTLTVSPQPTPVWAKIDAKGSDGAIIREKPGYGRPVVKTLFNGMLVEVLPEVIMADGVPWVHVRMTDGKEGWIVRSLLATATPVPGW